MYSLLLNSIAVVCRFTLRQWPPDVSTPNYLQVVELASREGAEFTQGEMREWTFLIQKFGMSEIQQNQLYEIVNNAGRKLWTAFLIYSKCIATLTGTPMKLAVPS